MKVIEDNWGSFPRTAICNKCKSKVELESREDCEYQPYRSNQFFERDEAFIWECPCCKTKNYIYV